VDFPDFLAMKKVRTLLLSLVKAVEGSELDGFVFSQSSMV